MLKLASSEAKNKLMRPAGKIKTKTIKAGTNPLSLLGKPFFQLFLLLIALFAFLFLLTLRLYKKASSLRLRLPMIKLSPLKFLLSLDNFLTSVLYKRYLRKAVPKSLHPPSFRVIIILLLTLSWSYYFYIQIFLGLPSPHQLKKRSQKLTTQILDRNGQLLFKIYQDENRTPVSLNSLPPYVKNAFLAIEDNGFYYHSGFSVSSVIRAIYHNISRQRTEGGSTITQQLVKNALLTNEKTWQRKVKEFILAIAVESVYNKDQILEMYLNEVGFGGPAYGVQEAAKQYFGVNASDVTLPQAAFLAGLPKAPSKYSPYLNPQLSLARQNLVLNLMLKVGYISQDQFEKAVETKLEFAPPKIEINAPHFVMFVRDLLVDQYGEELISHGGLRVTTTLDLKLQRTAESVLNQELNRLAGMNVNNGSALITRPNSGEILAMVGSKNYFDLSRDGQVNLTTSLRQPGSSIKVVNYALAFENGATPNTLVKDEPISFNLPGSGLWTPKNYDGRFHGTLPIRYALANSYNIPAILLLAKNGIANMVALGKNMGITSWNDSSRYGLALTLGGAEIKMTDMAVVYGTLANNGTSVPLNPILKIEGPTGKILTYDPCLTGNPCQNKTVLKPETTFFLNDILSDNTARSAAFGYRSVLNLGLYPAAVKTGTSNDLRDNWTIGYTPDYLVAAWVGNNDNSPMSHVVSGITGASPIWSQLMTYLLKNNTHNNAFTIPNTLVRLPICALTGTLTCSGCPTRNEYFTKGSEPKVACNPDDIKKIIEDRASQILNGATATRTN